MKNPLHRWHLCLAFLVATACLQAAAPEPGTERLRKLLKLPMISLETGFSFKPEGGFSPSDTKVDVSREISEARKELKGDSSDAQRYTRLGDLYAKSGDAKKSDDSYHKAATFFRQQAATRPDDPELLASWGRALWADGRNDEAESVLRRAIRI